jgi:hypothetical protein
VPNTLFSTYSQGENRVTASILAVFERISFALVEKILTSLCDEENINLLKFTNQPKGELSVPDAVISASFAYWIETKTKRNSVRKEQLENHLNSLKDAGNYSRQRLLVITPDVNEPIEIKEIGDKRLAWANFDKLVDILTSFVTRNDEWMKSDIVLPTEREQELLRELVRFLRAENLIGRREQAVVVAARIAWDEYQQYSVYMCQPNRTFQPSSHLAFYAQGKIQPLIPAIIGQVESVILNEEAIASRKDIVAATRHQLIELASKLQVAKNERYRQEVKVMFLTSIDDNKTLKLSHAIENNLNSAFVQGQRYVSLEKLKKNPTETSQLID